MGYKLRPRNKSTWPARIARGVKAAAGVYKAYKTTQKRRYRGAGSRTKLQRRMPGQSGLIQSGSNGITTSRCKLSTKTFPFMKQLFREHPTGVSRKINTRRVDWAPGAQGVFVYTIGNRSSIEEIYTASGASSTIGGTTNSVALKGYSSKLTFTNQSNANTLVTIYDVEYKKDTRAGEDNETSIDAWNHGMYVNTVYAGSAAQASTRIGTTPFISQDFCRNFKVTKVTKVYMELGKSHVHYFASNRARKLTDRMLDLSGSYPVGYRGLTHDFLVVCQGMPVNDGTDKSLIAMGSGGLSVVIEETFNWVQAAPSEKKTYLYDNQGAIATEKLMNEATGEVDVYEDA